MTRRRLTIIANYVPLEEPAGGPNFFQFDRDVRYQINIDNNGDAKADVTYRFKFKTRPRNTNFAGIPTFLYNDGPDHQPDRRRTGYVLQTYAVERNGDTDRLPPPDDAGQHRAAVDPELRRPRGKARPHPRQTGPRSSPVSVTTPSSSTSARSSI